MEGQAQDDNAAPMPPLPPPPGHDMYIVQFPKDQVYRVPPRENALIVERFRNPPNVKRKRSSCCFSCCCPRLLLTISLILVSIVAIIGITYASLYFIYNPKGPKFTVTNVVVKKPGNKNSPPKYKIYLRARNPNKKLRLDYEKNAEVTLLFEETKVATGKFPKLEQAKDASSNVTLELTGTKGPLPKQMEKSMNDDKTKTQVALDLEMKLGVSMGAAGLKTWDMKSGVVCNVKVNTLGKEARVLSQECHTDFKQY